MTPTDDESQVEPASAADETAVRRLLADARAAGPVPPDVAARLDATLAGLVADREQEAAAAQDEVVAPVVPLTSRRRRTAAGLLVAAAAVVVGGVAVGQYLDRSPAGDASNANADAGAVDRGAAADEQEAGATREEPRGSAPGPGVTTLDQGDTLMALPPLKIKPPPVTPQVRPNHLRADLEWIQLAKLDGVRRGYYLGSVAVLPRGFQCASAPWGAGIHFGVRYEGRSAMAAYREPQGDNQVVEVLQCETAEVLRSTTLPSRVPHRP